MTMPLYRRLLAEFTGTALLLAVIVGSGIMGVRLGGGNAALALLANAAATAAALYVLIETFASVSGAHFNPVVTGVLVAERRVAVRDALAYFAVQLPGAITGVVIAHAMFDEPILQRGTHARTGLSIWLAESVATFGLVLTVTVAARRRPGAAAALVAAWIFAAYLFTSSTAFANPAVTVARALTDSFAGIRPIDVPAFVAAQIVGAGLAFVVARSMRSSEPVR